METQEWTVSNSFLPLLFPFFILISLIPFSILIPFFPSSSFLSIHVYLISYSILSLLSYPLIHLILLINNFLTPFFLPTSFLSLHLSFSLFPLFHLFSFSSPCSLLPDHKNSLKLEDCEASFKLVNELIYDQQLQYDLVDFDNHLDDVSKDWSNRSVNKRIESLLTTLREG